VGRRDGLKQQITPYQKLALGSTMKHVFGFGVLKCDRRGDNFYRIGLAEKLHLGGRTDTQVAVNKDDILGFVLREIKYKVHCIGII
jgi:hypothetical protein